MLGEEMILVVLIIKWMCEAEIEAFGSCCQEILRSSYVRIKRAGGTQRFTIIIGYGLRCQTLDGRILVRILESMSPTHVSKCKDSQENQQHLSADGPHLNSL